MNHVSAAKMTLSLGALFGQYVTHVRTLALVATRAGTLEPLGSAGYALLLVGHCLTPEI